MKTSAIKTNKVVLTCRDLMDSDEYNGPTPENRGPLGKAWIYSDSEIDDHNGGVCD